MWKIVYTGQARKDAKKIIDTGLRQNVETLLEIIKQNPFKTPPPYEKLLGDLKGAYSRRINIRHRLVYEVLKDIKTIKVIRIWTHYQ